MEPWNASTLPRPGGLYVYVCVCVCTCLHVCVCGAAFRLWEIALAKASLEKLRVRQRKGLSQVHTRIPFRLLRLNHIVRARTQAWITTPRPELWPLTPYLWGCPNGPDPLGMWC